jgi:DNA-binding transcriptional regulator YiaG
MKQNKKQLREFHDHLTSLDLKRARLFRQIFLPTMSLSKTVKRPQLGEDLVAYRKALGLTQGQLAKRWKKPRSLIAMWETGARTIPQIYKRGIQRHKSSKKGENVTRKRPHAVWDTTPCDIGSFQPLEQGGSEPLANFPRPCSTAPDLAAVDERAVR